jgi:nitrogenase molybdenum-iron protein beta chain
MSLSALERPRWSCALGGALATAGALPDTIPIMHSGPGCAGNFTWTQNGASGLQVAGSCAGLTYPSSNLQEYEVVFGGLDRLKEELLETFKIMEGSLYFVLTGCIPEVIGDDVESLIAELKSQKYPVVFASTAGFKGSSYYGYEEVLKTLIKDVVRPATRKKERLVNIFGIVPMMDVFWRGNLKGIQKLLDLLGYKSQVFFGPQANLEDIKNSAKASLNIVVSDVFGVEAAELFKEIHGVDFITTTLPFGAAASERFLKTTGEALGLSSTKINNIIQMEGKLHYQYLEPLIDVYNDMDGQRYAIVIGDSNYAYAVADFISEDLGWIPELVFVTDQLPPETIQKIKEKRGQNGGEKLAKVIFESSSKAITAQVDQSFYPDKNKKYHNNHLPAFVLGSSLDRKLAQAIGAPHLSLSFPVANRAVINRGYTGYSGGLHLMEDILSVLIQQR